MTFLQKIEPYLTSDDLLVQQFVLHALSDYPNVPAEWTNQLIREAITKKEKEAEILIGINRHSINEEGLILLLKGIQQASIIRKHLYFRLIQTIPPSILLKYRDELAHLFSNDWWDFYDLLLYGEEEEVWGAYGSVLNELEDLEFHNGEIFSKAKHLIQTLVKNGWLNEREVDIVLQEELNKDWFSYNGILMIHAIGLLQYKKFIPMLPRLLVRDEDILLEELAKTLISFQSDEVVREIAPFLKSKEAEVFAISILENTKTPLAFETLQLMYKEMDNMDSKSMVIEGLCHHLNEQALPQVQDFIQQNGHSIYIDVEKLLYGFYTVMKLPHPLLEQWKKIAEENEARYQEMIEKSSPIIKLEKVGRNDPCPCGSGKKYKKCCLN